MEETTTQIIDRRLRAYFANENNLLDPKLGELAIKIERLRREIKDDDEIDDSNAEYAPH